MSTQTLWGSVSAGGTFVSNSSGVSIAPSGNPGEYMITFIQPFSAIPAIVGSQTGFGDDDENTLDGVVFPVVSPTGATALTGDSTGSLIDRSFSFLAVGPD